MTHRSYVVEIIAQQRLVVRVSTILYYFMRTTYRTLAAEVGKALLGNDDVYIMFGRVYVAAHRNDGTNLATLGNRRRSEDRYVAIALIVARTTNTIH